MTDDNARMNAKIVDAVEKYAKTGRNNTDYGFAIACDDIFKIIRDIKHEKTR
jgi:hypothetical protein